MKNLKFIGFLIVIAGFFLSTLIFYPCFLILPSLTRKFLVEIVSFYARIMLWILGIKAEFKNADYFDRHPNYLIVSNHLSYIDVMILASRFPACFVTSQEVRRSFFLGQIVSLAGCLFVDRKNRSQLKDEINELREALQTGLNVTVFPEATSTNGDEVLRFRRPLFESSLATEKPILPMTINYKCISGEALSMNNRDTICWYGDMDFFPHFMTLLEQSEIKAEVILSEPFLPELMPTIELALKSHELVSRSFQTLNLTTPEVT